MAIGVVGSEIESLRYFLLRHFNHLFNELTRWFDIRKHVFFCQSIGVVVVTCLPHSKQFVIETSSATPSFMTFL